MVTVTAARDAATWAAAISADAYVAKPFEIDQLLAVVAACNSATRAHGSHRSPLAG